MYDDFFQKAYELTQSGQPFATATVVRAEKPTSAKPGDRAIVTLAGTMFGWIGGSCAQHTVVTEAQRAIRDDRSRLLRLSPAPGRTALPEGMVEAPMTCFSGGTLDVYIEPQQPTPRLIVIGSLPVARALAYLGKAMNYRVVVVDPDGGSTPEPADEFLTTLEDIPSRITPLTFVVVASHGHFDEAAVSIALETAVPYIGLVASRARAESILDTLRAQGVNDEALERLSVPAGIDIQARRGDEIALSIMAEVVQRRRNLEELAWSAEEDTAAPPPSATAVDPVCHMEVPVAASTPRHEHAGGSYYFCCTGCREKFADDPDRYLVTN